ncbi:MAG: hypothetical protein FWE62_06635 [Firmicutes bacterium]|nr:hypothetical protein [Bacillota bacterium]
MDLDGNSYITQKLYMRPSVTDFRVFLSTASGYGTAGVKDGKPFVNAVKGTINVREIIFDPAEFGQ